MEESDRAVVPNQPNKEGQPSTEENVAYDPHVRLKIGDQLYDRTLVLVTDPAEQGSVSYRRSASSPIRRRIKDQTPDFT